METFKSWPGWAQALTVIVGIILVLAAVGYRFIELMKQIPSESKDESAQSSART